MVGATCRQVPSGHARRVRCLHKNVDEQGMGQECKAEVRRSMTRISQDYRLNYRLNKACSADVATLCKDACAPYLGQACGGTVLRCLQDNLEKITGSDCQQEVFYFIKMEVRARALCWRALSRSIVSEHCQCQQR